MYKRDTKVGIKLVGSGGLQLFYYCPWCGTKLPSELCAEWDDIVKKEYNLNHDKILPKEAPTEMQTDKWWKKRGL